jgi:hypothetical protein
MNPIGLTRAEEERERSHEPPTATVPAPPGALACRIGVPPEGRGCGAAATGLLVWPDGDKTPACAACAAQMAVVAQAHHSSVRVEPLP